MSSFKSGNWIQVHKSLIHQITSGAFSKSEIQVLLFIYEKTYLGRSASKGGSLLMPKEISRSDISNQTGIHPNTVRKILKGLLEKGAVKISQERSKRLKNRLVNTIQIKTHGAEFASGADSTSEANSTPEYGVDSTPEYGANSTPESGANSTPWRGGKPPINTGSFTGRKISLKTLFKTSLKRDVVHFLETRIKYEGKANLIAQQYIELERKFGFDLVTQAEKFNSKSSYMDSIQQPTTLIKFLSRSIEINRIRFEDEIMRSEKERKVNFEELFDSFSNHLDSSDNESPPELTQSIVKFLDNMGKSVLDSWTVFNATAHMVNKSKFIESYEELYQRHQKVTFGIYQ